MKISELQLDESAKSKAFDELLKAVSRSKSAEQVVDGLVYEYIRTFGKLSEKEIANIEKIIGRELSPELRGGQAVWFRSKEEYDEIIKKFYAQRRALKIAKGMAALNKLTTLGISTYTIYQTMDELNNLDLEYNDGKGEMSMTQYQEKREKIYGQGIERLTLVLGSWLATRFATGVARFVLSPVDLFGWLTGIKWVVNLKNLALGVVPNVFLVELAKYLNSDEGKKGLATAYLNEVMEIDVLLGAGAVHFGLDEWRVKIQNLINKYVTNQPEIQLVPEPNNPADKVTNPNDPRIKPVAPGDSASRHWQSYGAAGDYAPVSQGIKGTPDKSKWKKIGNGLIQDPITGNIDSDPEDNYNWKTHGR